MALMITVSVLGVNGTPFTGGAQNIGIATQRLIVRPGTSPNIPTAVTIIETPPDGLNQKSKKYYSATAAATIITAVNA